VGITTVAFWSTVVHVSSFQVGVFGAMVLEIRPKATSLELRPSDTLFGVGYFISTQLPCRDGLRLLRCSPVACCLQCCFMASMQPTSGSPLLHPSPRLYHCPSSPTTRWWTPPPKETVRRRLRSHSSCIQVIVVTTEEGWVRCFQQQLLNCKIVCQNSSLTSSTATTTTKRLSNSPGHLKPPD
jgi:hypothetical protein